MTAPELAVMRRRAVSSSSGEHGERGWAFGHDLLVHDNGWGLISHLGRMMLLRAAPVLSFVAKAMGGSRGNVPFRRPGSCRVEVQDYVWGAPNVGSVRCGGAPRWSTPPRQLRRPVSPHVHVPWRAILHSKSLTPMQLPLGIKPENKARQDSPRRTAA